MWDTFFDQINVWKLIPVVSIEKVDQALPLAKVLEKEGLPCVEITFRTAAAADSIREIANSCPNVLVGAGTVINVEQAEQAILNGAKFVVSPGLSESVVRYCIEKDVPVIPGCATPTEITKALELGLNVVKFFPAENMGGVKMVKALAAPFPQVKFVPTGGINQNNLKEYLNLPFVTACGGSWLVDKKLIHEEQFDEIAGLTRNAVELIRM